MRSPRRAGRPASPEALGRQVTGLVLAGDSAGGNFTIVTALALRDEPAAVPVLAQWPIYPASDPATRYPSKADFGNGYMLTEASMDWFDECYAADESDWRYAPLIKSQAGMPPTSVITASLDPIRDQGRAYAAACVAGGVPTIFLEAKGNVHGFVNLRRAIPSRTRHRPLGRGAEMLLRGETSLLIEAGLRPPPYRPGGGGDAAESRGQGLGRPAAR